MSAVNMVDPDFSMVYRLVDRWMRTRKPVVIGSRKKEAEAAEYRLIGWQEGLAEGLAAIATAERAAVLSKWSFIPSVEAHHVRKMLGYLEDIWDVTIEVNEPGSKDMEYFWAEMGKAYAHLVLPEDMAEKEKQRHIKAVMAGEEAATPADSEWIRETIEEQDKQRQYLERLLESHPEVDPQQEG